MENEKECPFQEGEVRCKDCCPLCNADGRCAFERIAAALERLSDNADERYSLAESVALYTPAK